MIRLETALLTCMHMEALIPVLNLSDLPCLEHLSLQDVYPCQLSIPPTCRLDLHGEAQAIQQVCFPGPNSGIVLPLGLNGVCDYTQKHLYAS